MHSFVELVDSCTNFTLTGLEEVNTKTVEELQTSGATRLVKALQMISLQKAIIAVGTFSMFEAVLQDQLGCKSGFTEAQRILKSQNATDLNAAFRNVYLAINVLKHGRGHSYDALVAQGAENLPFRVKMPDESFFREGDVDEISTLVQVDTAFVQYCSHIISEVSQVVGLKDY